jgi:uncharacterized protein (TIGR02117 family)
MRFFLLLIIRSLLGFIAFVMCYLLCAFWLPLLKVNTSYVPAKEGISIFIESNGVHTDFIIPSRYGELNCFRLFPCADFDRVDSNYTYVGVGWGDKGFYIDTRTWADLKFSTAFKAVFGLSSTAMHVRYLYREPREDENCKRLVLTPGQFEQLKHYILSSFDQKQGCPQHIHHAGYGSNDTFYEAQGSYSLFKTCNVWTGNGLKQIGVKTGIWSPFEEGIMEGL